MSGWKDWAIGEVVTETDFQSFVQDQVVQIYDDATDRDNTLGTAVAHGMVAYLKDVDETQAYNGTAWVSVAGAADITGVTAGTALTGGGTAGDVTLDVDISALATAHAGTALVASGELLDVDLAAVGSGIDINATQINYTLTLSTATAYTIGTADANTYVRLTNAGTVTVSTATDFTVGDQVSILADGTALTITTDGATIAGAGTAGTAVSFTVGEQYEAVSVLCVDTDTYRVIGNVTPV